jgi:hypothetical protein
MLLDARTRHWARVTRARRVLWVVAGIAVTIGVAAAGGRAGAAFAQAVGTAGMPPEAEPLISTPVRSTVPPGVGSVPTLGSSPGVRSASPGVGSATPLVANTVRPSVGALQPVIPTGLPRSGDGSRAMHVDDLSGHGQPGR